jgi:hypothetical protein
MHFLARPTTVDDGHAVRILAGEREKALTHALMELGVLGFEPIGRRAGAAAASAREADLDRAVEHESQVGQEALARHLFDRADCLQRKLPPVGLIGQRRVREAIAEHHDTCLEGRANQALHVLGTVGEDQEELGEPADVGRRMQEQLANPLAERRSARLACDAYGKALPFEGGGKEADLGRLAAAFDTFDRDERGLRRIALRRDQEEPFPSTSFTP